MKKLLLILILSMIFVLPNVYSVVINFTSDGSWVVPAGVSTVKVLVVAGGGGGGITSAGGSGTGGGGAGGLIYNDSYPVFPGTNVSIIVGKGGLAVKNGTNSTFLTLNAKGGGAGNDGTLVGIGYAGGSGGGSYSGGGGTGYLGQGNNGGTGTTAPAYGAGGGGGSNGTGFNATSSNGGRGGNGTFINLTGMYYAGGGGGGTDGASYPAGLGASGGGTGCRKGTDTPTSGINGTGGGGGGGCGATAGGRGGDGIVIISYEITGTPTYSGLTTGQTNNTKNIILNVSCSIGNISIWFDGNSSPSIKRITNSTINPYLFNFSSYVTNNGKYYLVASCNDGIYNGSILTWTYDDISPLINLNPSTSFNTFNSTILYSKNLSINLTGTDNIDLYGFEFLIYNSSGSLFYNKTNLSLTGLTSYTWQNYTDITNWKFGTYYWNTTWADSHTNNDEFKDGKDYKITKTSRTLTFDTWQKNKIDIESNLDIEQINIETKQDRKSFEIVWKKDLFGKVAKKKIITVECDKELTEMKSGYNAHFDCVDWNTKQGNWVDFENNLNEVPKITEKKRMLGFGNKYYELEFNNDAESMTFNSIGGLNFNSLNGYFVVSNLTLNTVSYNYVITNSIINFTGFVNATENLNYSINYEYLWYYNNTPNISGTINNSLSNVLTSIGTLINPNFNKNTNITFSAKATSNNYSTQWKNYSLIYNFAITDCSIGISGITNATSYYFMFIDGSLNSLLNVNLSTQLEYVFGGNTYNYYTASITSNFSYCIFPSDINVTASFQFNYYYNNILYSYVGTDSNFDNIVNNINLSIFPSSTTVMATVYDEINQFVEDCYIEVYRYDTATGNYNLFGTYITNFEGQVQIPLTVNTQKYIFKLYYPVGNIVKTTSATYIYSSAINFQIVKGDVPLTDYYTELDIVGNISFNNNTNKFTYYFSDASAEISNGCLYLYKQYNGVYGFYNSSCVSATAGIIILPVQNQTNALYVAKGFVTLNEQQRLIDEDSYFYTDSNITTKIGLTGILIDFILTVVFTFIFTFSIPIAIMVLPIPSIILAYMGLISISIPVLWTIEILAIIIAIMINNRG